MYSSLLTSILGQSLETRTEIHYSCILCLRFIFMQLNIIICRYHSNMHLIKIKRDINVFANTTLLNKFFYVLRSVIK